MAKAFAVVLLLFNALGLNTGIRLDGNGYTDILVAINPAVPQNENIINQIKAMITSGSEYLLKALDNKVFIKDVKILIPPNWRGSYGKAKRETYDKANIIIDSPHPAHGDEPYTKQMKGCGEESEYIHFTPDFLLNDDLLNAYGPRDGEATDDIQSCLQSAVDSGAIINTIALGPSASNVLVTMANKTDGKFIIADENLISNQLVDAFSSFTMSDGDLTKQTIQLVSTGSAATGWFNGTVPIDRTVGNSTTFTIIYERSAPTVYIQAPSGSVHDQTRMAHNAATKTLTLNIPGTAEPGDWRYSFFNTESSAQAMTLTVTSRAARDNVPPVMVKAQMNQLTSDGTKPMVVFAEVSQNHMPVLGAKVMATLQSDTGHSEELFLLDNGAGADNFKDDGIYSRYFTKLINGRYSLKVQVIHQEGAISGSHNRNSGALYVPGYIVNGKVQLNSQKPPVSVQLADVGRFTRTATGKSFVVNVPKGVTPKFPPGKITDLRAKIQVDTIFLSWTAPGEDFDLGTVESYDVRWSKHLKTVLYNFSDAIPVNTSALQPQEAGLDEQFSFLPEVAIQNGTTLFFAIRSQDKQALTSEVSNIARVTKFVPSPKPPEISKPPPNLLIVLLLLNALGPNIGIKLDGNGYTDILIAINPAVPQNDEIINQIKGMIINGSDYLFQALDHKVFIKEVKILVPPSWNGSYHKARRETYKKARIIIEPPQPSFGDDPYTKQMKGCGEESEYTHFTPDFLLNDGLLGAYGPRGDHNTEAPNMQNQKCNYKATRTVIFQDSVDRDALQTLTPLQSSPPPPTFSVIQRRHRVVCLILDVSGSMRGNRVFRQQQAATLFLSEIVEEGAYVGIVTFSTGANILNPLMQINGKASRDSLIEKLPTTASGVTNMCTGLARGFEVLKEDDQSTVGDDVIFLTDGEATDDIAGCLDSAVASGAIINTLALGPDASTVLTTMATLTGGSFVKANDSLISNQLVEAFSSFTMSDGDPIKQTIQLVSTGKDTRDWFNGTVPIDHTVGNSTTFTIIYERSAPTVYIQTPSGSVYDQRHITDNTNTITLIVPGTAEPGDWKYSFLNTESTAQAMALTVTSRAARNDVPPVTVQAQMNQQTSDGTKPMIVFAEVSQNRVSVLGAKVIATLQSDTGHSENLYLLDNGAGADNLKDDGIYSRYFTKLRTGRYSLKVEVTDHKEDTKKKVSPSRYSSALYIPGYIVDGQVQLNPEKPPVSVQSADVGSFTRTVTGESFVVSVPPGVTPPNFPPNKITDLSAEIQEDTVFLNWTAPGEDFDQGTGEYCTFR
ncbi:hypothetical protein AOLI_G00324770 [Acnodon oligacanthus]